MQIVLVVEDDDQVRHVISDMLKEEYVVREVCDLAGARVVLGLAQREGIRVDAILLDLGLPDSLSDRTLERVFRAACGIPIVVFTGDGDEELCIAAGAKDFLRKDGSITAELLCDKLSRAMLRPQVAAEFSSVRDMLRDSAKLIGVAKQIIGCPG